MKKIKLTDWQERALKTFVQAFFGVVIPEVIVMLQHGTLADLSVLKALLCSALAAGISAVWNICKERSVQKEVEEHDGND